MMGSSAVMEPPSDVTKRSIRACAPESVRTITETSGAPLDAGVLPGVRTTAATKIVRIAPARERRDVRDATETAVDGSVRGFSVDTPLLLRPCWVCAPPLPSERRVAWMTYRI